jgi:hypothetical protein
LRDKRLEVRLVVDGKDASCRHGASVTLVPWAAG